MRLNLVLGAILIAITGAACTLSAESKDSAASSVTSLNTLKGKLTLVGGTGTSIVQSGSRQLTITGFVMPYSGSSSTAYDCASFENTGSGTALYCRSVSQPSIWVENSSGATGLFLLSTPSASDALWVSKGAGGGGAAGSFFGDVNVVGAMSKSSGSFKIDHPLDPENLYLYHSFVESPDMMNIYNGNAILDRTGEAVVELPEWFEALNRDFRYQLTAVGGPGPNLYVAEKIAGNHFRIAGGSPGLEVSWQVTGIRQDAWANAHRVPVEEQKSDLAKGHYLHPELFGQPSELSVEAVDRPHRLK